jgi:hypothetical protein
MYFCCLGSAKLGLSGNVTVVLEVEGTEVDDDDMLESVKGDVLMLLQDGESWTPRGETVINVHMEPEQPVTPKQPMGDVGTAGPATHSGAATPTSRPSSPASGNASRGKGGRFNCILIIHIIYFWISTFDRCIQNMINSQSIYFK